MAYLEMVVWIAAGWFAVALVFGLIFGTVMRRGLGPWD